MELAIKESVYKNEIEVLDLSERAKNVLKRNKFVTIEDVLDRQEELPKLKNLGVKTLTEIKNKIWHYQLEKIVDERGL